MDELYQYPQETWTAAECERRSKVRQTDGYGSKHPYPGLVQGSGCAVVYYGEQRFNGGTTNTPDGEWYRGYNRPWPAIPPEYEFYVISSWGTYIRRKP